MIGRALAVGIITAPFISAALLALGRSGRTLTRTTRTLIRRSRNGMVQR
jgi:hypothetical protein